MKLIIGLGNPGRGYERTRHNTGFLFVDVLREKWDFPDFAPEKKFASLVSAAMKDGEKTLLVKPETFMNRSGESVSALINFFKLTPADIAVIHDDLDLPFGTWKEAFDSGAAGHNGVASIIETLGTKEFRRVRIGIGRPARNASRLGRDVGGSEGDRDPADYVLARFTAEEEQKLPEIFGEIQDTL
jgi:PTH1 family peptidyl-tRNA hydrolase